MSSASNQRIIFVTGVTGSQGGSFAKHFLQSKDLVQGWKIRGLTRDINSEGAKKLKDLDKSGGQLLELVEGNLTDKDKMRNLLSGCFALLLNLEPGALAKQAGYPQDDLVHGSEIERDTGIAMIDAARDAGVSMVVYHSIFGVDEPTDVPHNRSKFYIHQHLKQNADSFKYTTVIRPTNFAENMLRQQYLTEGLSHGVLNYPLPRSTNLSLISTDDIGKACLNVFLDPEGFNGRVIDLAGFVTSVGELESFLGLKHGDFPRDKLHYDYQQYYTFLEQISPTQTKDLVDKCQDVLPDPIGLERWYSMHKDELNALRTGSVSQS